jgi:hypothetical protein
VLDEIYSRHQETLSIIRYHAWWPGSNDPYYLANILENTARINYYSIGYVPYLWIDGDVNGRSSYSQWDSLITSEENVLSPLSIDLAANYGNEGDYGTITAVITATDTITYTNLKTRFCITESHLPPYAKFDEFNNVMRDMIPDASGFDLTIFKGDSVVQQVTYNLSNDWNFANLDIIAFVQSDSVHRVLQAARLTPSSGALTGIVTSSESGFPIPNATVYIENTSYGDVTDSQGNYVFSFLPGSQSIVVGAVGFDPDTLEVVIAQDDTTVFDIQLNPGTMSSITGNITDPNSGTGLLSYVTLYMNGDSLMTVETDTVTGAYTFSGINVSMPPWVVYTDLRAVSAIPYPIVNYGDTIDVVEGKPTVIDFDVLPSDIFLVDDDEGDSYENYFMDEISSTGRTYYRHDVNEAGQSAMNYIQLFPATSTVVWFTGDATTGTITESEQDSLAKFLDQGGSLFLTGQNLAEELDTAQSDFLQDYFHVSHGGNVTYFISHGVYGNPVTGYLEFFLTFGGGGGNNQASRDLLISSAPAEEFIYYINNPLDLTPQGTSAVYVEGTNNSKAILMGFGFEAINRSGGNETQATREETMLAILNWFDGIVDFGDDGYGGGIQLPGVVVLHQNYPNPFNPSTTIQYDIPMASRTVPVEINIYDIRGRLVRKLIDQEREPGRYRVHWDGRNERGLQVSSGLYIYRLLSDGLSISRKMLILR